MNLYVGQSIRKMKFHYFRDDNFIYFHNAKFPIPKTPWGIVVSKTSNSMLVRNHERDYMVSKKFDLNIQIGDMVFFSKEYQEWQFLSYLLRVVRNGNELYI